MSLVCEQKDQHLFLMFPLNRLEFERTTPSASVGPADYSAIFPLSELAN